MRFFLARSGSDRVSIVGLKDLAPGSTVTMVVHKKDGSKFNVTLNHTFNEDQLNWFRAGSALNYMKQQQAASGKQ